MRSHAGRTLLGVALLIAAVGLLLVLKDSGNDTGTGGTDTDTTGSGSATERRPAPGGKAEERKSTAVPTIVVRNGEPVGGLVELGYRAGERIRFRVTSDASDEIHVHGYDISKEIDAGDSVGFNFPASIEGVFEVELEHRGEQILELRVNP